MERTTIIILNKNKNMVNLIIIILILSTLRNIIYNNPMDILCCGIWGGSSKKGKKLDIAKLVILGLYNRTRGTDSCGYYFNGNLVKGIEKESDFKDFLAKNPLTRGELPGDVFMGHARKSSSGYGKDLENAHPHDVGELIQTHNGTISNIWNLAKSKEFEYPTGTVDSIVLANLIQKEGYGVLNEYKGHAALTHVFKEDPETLYLYHGASRTSNETNKDTVWEERPLYYCELSEGLYYSSLEEALIVIANGKAEVKILPHNNVYPVHQGKLKSSIKKIERQNMNVVETYVYPKNPVASSTYQHNRREEYWKGKNGFFQMNKVKELPFDEKMLIDTTPSIWLEPKPKDLKEYKEVIYWKGRHMRVGMEFKKQEMVESYYLLNGQYCIDRESKILNTENEKKYSKAAFATYYFVRGIMMRDEKAYNECKNVTLEQVYRGIASSFSVFSKYPVSHIFGEAVEAKTAERHKWYQNAIRYSGTFIPKFNARRYGINAGYLSDILDGEDCTVITKLHSTEHVVYPLDVPFIDAITIRDNKKEDSFADGQINYEEPPFPINNENDIEELSELDLFINKVYVHLEEQAEIVINNRSLFELSEIFIMFVEDRIAEMWGEDINSDAVKLQLREFFTEIAEQNISYNTYIQNNRVEIMFSVTEEDARYLFNDYLGAQDVLFAEQKNRFELAIDNGVENTPKKKEIGQEKQSAKIINMQNNNEDYALLQELEIKVAEETYALIRSQLMDLTKLADELQALDTLDKAQNIAASIYLALPKIDDLILKSK